jgi:hypothetical protein
MPENSCQTCFIAPEISGLVKDLAVTVTKLENVVGQVADDKKEREKMWQLLDEHDTHIKEAKGTIRTLKSVGSLSLLFIIPILGTAFSIIMSLRDYQLKDEQRTEQVILKQIQENQQNIQKLQKIKD